MATDLKLVDFELSDTPRPCAKLIPRFAESNYCVKFAVGHGLLETMRGTHRLDDSQWSFPSLDMPWGTPV